MAYNSPKGKLTLVPAFKCRRKRMWVGHRINSASTSNHKCQAVQRQDLTLEMQAQICYRLVMVRNRSCQIDLFLESRPQTPSQFLLISNLSRQNLNYNIRILKEKMSFSKPMQVICAFNRKSLVYLGISKDSNYRSSHLVKRK